MFEHLRIILVNTSHPGNIGAAARAIKNMGFKHLCLVAPEAQAFPSDEAIARAAGAADILNTARVTQTLDEALEGCEFVLGLSARDRKIAWPMIEPSTAALKVLEEIKLRKASVALVFGREKNGLLNEELAKCHYQVMIPANPEYASLNVAQVVQIMTYECRKALLTALGTESLPGEIDRDEWHCREQDKQDKLESASAQEMEYFYKSLEEVLIQIEFLDPEKPKHLMKRLRRLYSKARVDKTELNILQGILKNVQNRLHPSLQAIRNESV